jgi:hypothetical protein
MAAGPRERSQADVLSERFGQVPWRRAMRDAVQQRLGRGPTALPDRLEGAVYGHLAGGAAATAGQPAPEAASGRPRDPMLALLAALLDPASEAERGSSALRSLPPVTATADVLAVPLVLYRRDAAAVADVAARVAGPADGDGGARAGTAAAMYALLVRRLLAGERGRSAVLGRATRELRTLLDGRAVPDATDRAGVVLWSGWEAFAGASDVETAIARARTGAEGRPDPEARDRVALAGALAGLYWGSAGTGAARQRALPDASAARRLVDRLIETDVPAWDGEPWRTSTSVPLEVDAVDVSGLEGGVRGRLTITSLPGKRYVGYHTGAHWRDPDTDAARLHELGVDVLLLLVEDPELVRCRVTGIGEVLAAHEVELVRFPIRDPLVPRDGPAFHRTLSILLERLRTGTSVAIACRGGFDRAGMATACLLREAGLPAAVAIERVQRARPGALTLPDQQAFVGAWPPR